MNKREKIVVSVTGAVAAIALISVIPDLKRSAAPLAALPGQAQALTQQVAVLKQQLQHLQSGEQELAVLDWLKTDFPDFDPFISELPAMGLPTANVAVDPFAGTLVFQGSLTVAGRTIGWINDVEYAEGEILLSGDYRILQISRDQVILQPLADDTAELTVPIAVP